MNFQNSMLEILCFSFETSSDSFSRELMMTHLALLAAPMIEALSFLIF